MEVLVLDLIDRVGVNFLHDEFEISILNDNKDHDVANIFF